ncbi:MAG: hypothetical protein JWN57_61, partial [Frankiales bacterium]|nr:hypothetical protein [Frankiales bacterium]
DAYGSSPDQALRHRLCRRLCWHLLAIRMAKAP